MFEFLTNVNTAYIPFLLILLIVLFVVYNSHVGNNSFYVQDFLIDSKTGKASVEKLFIFTAGLSLTWWFVSLCSNSKVTVNDAIAYGGLLGLAKIADNLIKSKYPTPTPPPSNDEDVIK